MFSYFPGKVDALSFDVGGTRSSDQRSRLKVGSWLAKVENGQVKFKNENLKCNN